jgi:hypothetical protein
MGDVLKTRSEVPSRRSILRNFALCAGGAAILSTAVGKSRDAAAQGKMAQQLVGYQDTPRGPDRCDNCIQFQPPSLCKVVEGTIAPSGWCKLYVKKPA